MASPDHRLLVLQIGPHGGARLDKAVAAAVPEADGLSRTRIGELIRDGALVSAGGQALTSPSQTVREPMTVYLTVPPPVETAAQPEVIPLDVVFEDEALLVVNKPRGMVVHPGAGVPSGTLVNALLHHCAGSLSGIGGEARPGIVHRIDKDTSGLLVVAKNDRAHQGLAEQFAAHTAHRRYRAIVWGVPDPGAPKLRSAPGVSVEPGGILKVDAPLGRHPKDRLRMAVLARGGRRAVTRAQCMQAWGHSAEMSLWLETGRTHQIRVHFAHIGHPLVGDRVYGRRRVLPVGTGDAAQAAVAAFDGQALHAAELGFEHPLSGEDVHFEAAPPAAYKTLSLALSGAEIG